MNTKEQLTQLLSEINKDKAVLLPILDYWEKYDKDSNSVTFADWLKAMSKISALKLWDSFSNWEQDFLLGKTNGYYKTQRMTINKDEIVQWAQSKLKDKIRQYNEIFYDWHFNTYGWNAY